MQYSAAQDFLSSLINYEKLKPADFPHEFHLKKIKKLLSLLGNPQSQFKSIHIAGSKGKGSTSSMIAHVLHQAGYKVGLYTSPHIYDYHERIRVLGQTASSTHLFQDAIDEEALASCLTEMRPAIERVSKESGLGVMSFFEVYTALAFFYFSKQGVDYAVIETGLGGRLDATNVVESDIAVITTIDYEHVDVLGKTLHEIAREKVGIIKSEKQSVVMAPQDKSAELEICQRCEKVGCSLVQSGANMQYTVIDATIHGQRVHVYGEGFDYNIYLPLVGDYQIGNLLNALEVVRCLVAKGVAITAEAVEKGAAAVQWPIRFEVVAQSPAVILDAAHTGRSMNNLCRSLREHFPGKLITVILGVSDDKDLARLGAALQKLVCDVILTRADHPRAKDIDPRSVASFFTNVKKASTVAEALDLAVADTKDHVVVVTGSIFVASEARNILLKDKGICINTKD